MRILCHEPQQSGFMLLLHPRGEQGSFQSTCRLDWTVSLLCSWSERAQKNGAHVREM